MKRFLGLALGTAIVISLFATSVLGAEKVVLQLRWEPQFQFAGYYAALWQGYYADAGLEVEIRSAVKPDRSVLSATKEVADGRAHFGIGAADILMARDKGAPLTIAAVIFQQSPVAIFARKDANVSSPADLTTLRVRRVKTDSSNAQFVAMLAAEGIDPETIKSHLPGKWDGHTSALLADNKLDAYVGYTLTALWRNKVRGSELTILRPASYGVDFYGDTVFTTEQYAKRNPELVARFIAATRRGWEYALQNADATARRLGREIKRTFKVRDPVAFNLFQIKEVKKLMLHPVIQIGHINPDRWERMHQHLKRVGLVSGELDRRGLVFDPARDARETQRGWLIALLGAVAVTLVLLLAFFFWTRALRRVVAQRTRELNSLNSHLEQRVVDRTAELKDAQAAVVRSERLTTLGQLTATVSHELRNPLGVLRTSAFVLRQTLTTKDGSASRAIDRIERNITRCDKIIDELLDYGRIRELEFSPVEIDKWLFEILDEQPAQANFRIDRKPGISGVVAAIDPHRFSRAIINLYDNACQALAEKAANEPGSDLRLSVGTSLDNGRITIEFTDTGPGMTADVQSKLFEPLFSTKGFGVGLGLTVVQRIIEQHGGGVEVETEPGNGTTFRLWLPQRSIMPPAA